MISTIIEDIKVNIKNKNTIKKNSNIENKTKDENSIKEKPLIGVTAILITIFLIIMINTQILKMVSGISLYLNIIILISECILIIISSLYSYNKFKKVNIYTQKAIEEKEKLNGLKKYLEDYSLINDRKILDIYLWERYLAYATIFNINHNIMEILEVNLEKGETKDNKKAIEIKFDFYENKYFYIDDNNQKIYIKEKREE